MLLNSTRPTVVRIQRGRRASSSTVSRGGTYQNWIGLWYFTAPASRAISISASDPKCFASFQRRLSVSSFFPAPARRSSSSNPTGSLVRK